MNSKITFGFVDMCCKFLEKGEKGMNANIMNTQIFHLIKCDLNGH